MTESTKAAKVAITEEPEHETPSTGCGIIGRYPLLSILIFAASGIGLGFGLASWDPEDSEDKKVALKWIGLVGDMFIRALKATVLPMVFVNVILSMVDMMSVGSASSVGGKTMGLYLLTTLLASVLGLISILCFKNFFKQGEFPESSSGTIMLGCEDDAMLVHSSEGEVFCSANYTELDGVSAEFMINDVDGTFVKKSSGPASDLTMSDTIYDGVFVKIITSNIFDAFVDANFAAVVFFAICMGAALAKVMKKKGQKQADSTLVSFLKEVDSVLITLIGWIIMITPFAVFSLIANAIGKQTNLADSFSNVGYLVASTAIALIVHVVVVYFGLYYLLTKKNPIEYLKFIFPAQTTALACASSAATIPVTMSCARAFGIPDTIINFVIPMGATINMDGSAIYFPCACVWMAYLNGIEPNFGQLFLLIILATVGSAGSAPVPSAALVLIISAYNTVFGTTGTPDGFSFIIAIDWAMDRMRTSVNVTGDAFVTAIVAHKVAEMGLAPEDVIPDEETSEEGQNKEDSATDTKQVYDNMDTTC